MAFKHARTRLYDNGNTMIILGNYVENPSGPTVGGWQPDEAHAQVDEGLAAGGKEGLELAAEALLALDAHRHKLAMTHIHLKHHIESKRDEAAALGGGVFAAMRKSHQSQTARVAELEAEVAVHAEDLAKLRSENMSLKASTGEATPIVEPAAAAARATVDALPVPVANAAIASAEGEPGQPSGLDGSGGDGAKGADGAPAIEMYRQMAEQAGMTLDAWLTMLKLDPNDPALHIGARGGAGGKGGGKT